MFNIAVYKIEGTQDLNPDKAIVSLVLEDHSVDFQEIDLLSWMCLFNNRLIDAKMLGYEKS